MPNPRYVPKLYAVEPKLFGKRQPIHWRQADTLLGSEIDNLAAARFQHEVAFKARRAIHFAGVTFEDVADEHGVEAAWIGRILRGDTVMSLQAVAWLDRVFGIGALRVTSLQVGGQTGRASDESNPN
ncbi:helix-turn-helix domain-containing protein [Leifsonia aquatica]|uniref:Uncharacterized protein n=2 Tax=Leifsonia aquatica TaxID=144185 RepID=U2QDG1_LEIAQ|nr:helix-turn-helix transcriptional regulator [Leifsonia aquatica]ERK60905.1 hypothetical protein N136_04905 [Leifsonia aquatica ATCC 14665]MBB2967921.1 cyanate lyase [Leifsonia aquatica]